jgi:hypothetical protein
MPLLIQSQRKHTRCTSKCVQAGFLFGRYFSERAEAADKNDRIFWHRRGFEELAAMDFERQPDFRDTLPREQLGLHRQPVAYFLGASRIPNAGPT